MPERKPTRTADLDYFYGQSSELFSFYRIPKLLFQDSRFQPLTTDAKTLYGILLDRMSLSARNGWLDKAGRVFIIYTVQEVQDSLGCADKKATKLLRELEEYGLIERKRRGLGKPDLIYVKNFSSESSKTPYLNRDNDDSGTGENTFQDPVKLRCNKTERNNTEISDTDPIYSDENDWMSEREQLEEYFSHSLEVDLLLRLCPDDEDTIYQIVDLLVDTCATNRKLLHIAGDDKPAEVVRSRFMKLNADHIRFVLKCLAENSSPIRNMKQYLLASLYNAPTTIRQSFRPGEITAEEANKVGYELAMRFTKGKHAFVVATHTDRQHIHNHVIFNSTALDGTKKFRDFFFSALAVQRLSDLICLEHQLSVIEKKPYRERQKRVLYPPKESNRDRLCGIIDTILAEKPGDYEAFLQKLEQQGYEVKRGKHTAVKGKGQKRFIRFRTLGTGYSEDEIKAVLEGKAKHQPYQKKQAKEQSFQLLVDIQGKMAEGKSVGYKRWATKFNLKEMSKTLLFLQEQKIGSAEELRERAAAATERYHAMGDSIKAAEARLTEIAVLKTHIINYAKTRPVYDAYRKSGYSKKFLEAHREEITLHKAAKAAFDEAGLQKLPKVKELDAEFAELLTKKKAAYPDYRKARNEMQELVRAQKNVERFFAGEKDTIEKAQTR